MITELRAWITSMRKKARTTYQTAWQVNSADVQLTQWEDGVPDVASPISKTVDVRIEKKPVEVVNEILTDAPVINVVDIDKQIKIVERRVSVFKEQGCACSDELRALMFLKARKLFIKHSKLFSWPVTTEAKITELCKKYKLVVVGFQSYYKNVPMEAVDEIEKFANAYELVMKGISKDKPVFKLIIDAGGKERKKDPILLAGSPFGQWYYVCGAWDKEVQFVDDLVYNGK